MFLIPGPDVIPLKHYGKCEVLGKIANMEPEYDEPMHFDPDLLPAMSVAAGHQGFWDYGIEVAGKSKKYGKQTPTLEAGMYGFRGGKELLGDGNQDASGHIALFLVTLGSHMVHHINYLP